MRKEGHYKVGKKLTCLLAIEPGNPRLPPQYRGLVQKPRRSVRCIQKGGATVSVFRALSEIVCSDVETN